MEKKLVIHPRKPAYGKTTVVSARLPDDILKKLDGICQKTGRTRNELMALGLEFALKHIEIIND